MAIASIAKPSKWFSNYKPLKLPFLRLPSPKKPQKSPTPADPLSPRKPKITTMEKDHDEQFLAVFRFFDSNNDGMISIEELRAYFMSVGETMSHDEVQRVISEFDVNGDNLLEFKEFVRLMDRDRDDHTREGANNDDLRKAFEMFEVEKGCGCITPKGLRQVLKRLGGDDKSDEECEAMIRVFDLDGNGVLDFEEFQKMMT